MTSTTSAINVATHEKGFGQVQLNKSNQQDLLRQADQYDFSNLAIELRGTFLFFFCNDFNILVVDNGEQSTTWR